MHPSSMTNMQKAIDRIALGDELVVLDVGGRALTVDKDRSYQSLFVNLAKTYYIADIVDGPGVTHVMPGNYELPFEDDTFDVIVSGQTLEHVKNPFRLVQEMKRVLKYNGYMILIAPSSGPKHDVIDCWRFMDHAFKAIAQECELKVIADWIDRTALDERSRVWSDHVFIGQK